MAWPPTDAATVGDAVEALARAIETLRASAENAPSAAEQRPLAFKLEEVAHAMRSALALLSDDEQALRLAADSPATEEPAATTGGMLPPLGSTAPLPTTEKTAASSAPTDSRPSIQLGASDPERYVRARSFERLSIYKISNSKSASSFNLSI